MTTVTAQALFKPFSHRGLALPNRIVMAPMTRNHSPGGVPGEDVAAYYARRAAGGVGLIITEGTVVDHSGSASSDTVPRFYGEDALAGWRRVAEAVHAAEGRIIPQLWHVGAQRALEDPPSPGTPPVSPSGIPGVSGPMTETDIAAVIDAFAEAAASAQRLGFDGVEIHGAHGYLIDQFLWDRTNQRTDAYGRGPEGRSRFAAEVVAACRRAVGPGFPLVFRLSQWKVTDFEARIADSPADLEALLAPLAEAGVDVFHCSSRRFWKPEFPGSDLGLAGWTKRITGIPAITVGSVGLDSDFLSSLTEGVGGEVSGLDGLLARLEAEEFDLVAVGRALLADPAWPRKVEDGRLDELVPFDASMLTRLT